MCCAFVVDGRLGFSGLEGVDNDPLGAPRPKREGRWVLKVTALVGLPVAVAMSLTLVDAASAAGTPGAVVGRVAKLLLVFGNSLVVWPKVAFSNTKPPPDILFFFFVPVSVFLDGIFLFELVVINSVFQNRIWPPSEDSKHRPPRSVVG